MDEIKNQISDIAFSIKENEKIKNSEYFDMPLTGSELQFSAVDMIYLTLEIMKKFNVHFSSSAFESYHFNTINDIAQIVYDNISKQ